MCQIGESMQHTQLINQMVEYYKGDPKRIQHFIKVHEFASLIGQQEGLTKEQQYILNAAAIVHDIGIREAEIRYGNSNGKLQEELGPDIARTMLTKLNYQADAIERVCYLVGHHHTYTNIEGADYQILIEADFLVNLYEEGVNPQANKTAYHKIFRTQSGKWLMKMLFLVEVDGEI